MAKYRYRTSKFKTSPPSICKIRRHVAEAHDLIKSGFSITSIIRDIQVDKVTCYYSELGREGKPSISRWLTKSILGPYAPALLENYQSEKMAKLLERRTANLMSAQDPPCSSIHLSTDHDLCLDLKSKGYSMMKVIDYRGITSARQYKTQMSREDSETVFIWLSRKMFESDHEKLLLYEFQQSQRKDKLHEPSQFKKKPQNDTPSEPPVDLDVNDSTFNLIRDRRYKSGFRPVSSQEKPRENCAASKSGEVRSREIGVQVDLMTLQRCENCDEQRKRLTESTAQTELSYFVFDSVYCSK